MAYSKAGIHPFKTDVSNMNVYQRKAASTPFYRPSSAPTKELPSSPFWRIFDLTKGMTPTTSNNSHTDDNYYKLEQ